MKVSEIMKGPRLKVKRANSHIDSIIRDSAPLCKDLYEITNGPALSTVFLAHPDCFKLTYSPKQPIADYFGPIIGDAVNNLRESLDYWMNAALRAIGNTQKVHFPFSKEWKDLVTSPNYPAIQKAFPDAAEFILKDIKPCRDTNLHLWTATHLGNFNKHNDFIPTVTVLRVDNINARAGTNLVQNCSMGGNADGPIHMMRASVPITIDNNFSTSVEINFPEGAIFEHQPVIPTITQMSQVISETLDALETFIAPYAR